MLKKSTIHIAFLGPLGSYSHIAAIQYANRHFNHQITEYSCQKFSDILTSVESKQAEYGILPIENSNSGFIDEIFDLLLKTPLTLAGDIAIPIKHYILVANNTSLNHIQFILSHPQPIQQCSKFLKYFSKWKIILCKSSSGAIKTVAKLNQSNLAALGSIQGGILYGLKPLLLSNLSNHSQNITRFIILKHTTNSDVINISNAYTKTMILLYFNRQLNNLSPILLILNKYNIKITCLKSRILLHPKLKNIIIIEFIANLSNINIQHALIELKKIAYSLKILGCYPSLSNNLTIMN